MSSVLSPNYLDSLLGPCNKYCTFFHHNPVSAWELSCARASWCKFDLVTTAPCDLSSPDTSTQKIPELQPITHRLDHITSITKAHLGLPFVLNKGKVQAPAPGTSGPRYLFSAALPLAPGPRLPHLPVLFLTLPDPRLGWGLVQLVRHSSQSSFKTS